MEDYARGSAPRTYAKAAGARLPTDRSCDMGVKLTRIPERDDIIEFFKFVGTDKENMEG